MTVLLHTICFIFGFSVSFILLGAIADFRPQGLLKHVPISA